MNFPRLGSWRVVVDAPSLTNLSAAASQPDILDIMRNRLVRQQITADRVLADRHLA